MLDPCGVAGGHQPPDGGFGGIYVNTSHARLGDMGSAVLPPAPSGTIWQAGTAVEVSWTIEANHAGGYVRGMTCPSTRHVATLPVMASTPGRLPSAVLFALATCCPLVLLLLSVGHFPSRA